MCLPLHITLLQIITRVFFCIKITGTVPNIIIPYLPPPSSFILYSESRSLSTQLHIWLLTSVRVVNDADHLSLVDIQLVH